MKKWVHSIGFFLIMAVIVIGIIIRLNEEPIPGTCTMEEGCFLTYTGKESCAPCDVMHEDMKCLNRAKRAEAIADHRRLWKDMVCEPCAELEPVECICQEDTCIKIVGQELEARLCRDAMHELDTTPRLNCYRDCCDIPSTEREACNLACDEEHG